MARPRLVRRLSKTARIRRALAIARLLSGKTSGDAWDCPRAIASFLQAGTNRTFRPRNLFSIWLLGCQEPSFASVELSENISGLPIGAVAKDGRRMSWSRAGFQKVRDWL